MQNQIEFKWDFQIINGNTKNFLLFRHYKCNSKVNPVQALSAFNQNNKNNKNIKLPCCSNMQLTSTFEAIVKEVDCLLCPKKIEPYQKVTLKNGFSICVDCLKILKLLIINDQIKPQTTEYLLKEIIYSCNLCSALITLKQPSQNDYLQYWSKVNCQNRSESQEYWSKVNRQNRSESQEYSLIQIKEMQTELKKKKKLVKLMDEQLQQKQSIIRKFSAQIKQQQLSMVEQVNQKNDKNQKFHELSNKKNEKTLIYTSPPNFLKPTQIDDKKAVSQTYYFPEADRFEKINTQDEKTENSFTQSIINLEKQNTRNIDLKSDVLTENSVEIQSVQFGNNQKETQEKNCDQMNSRIGTLKENLQSKQKKTNNLLAQNEDSESSGSTFSYQTEEVFAKQSSNKDQSPGSRLSLSYNEEPQVFKQTTKPKFSNKVQTKNELIKTSPSPQGSLVEQQLDDAYQQIRRF